MARGNQRDLARAKNLKKQAEANKGRAEDGLTPQQRNERDKAAMEAKKAAKEAAKAAKEQQSAPRPSAGRK